MKRLLLVLIAAAFPLAGISQDSRPLTIHFPRTDLLDVLEFYKRLTGKPVLVSLDLKGAVTIESAKPLSREESAELIRKTLLEGHGIELRTSDRGETLATWSQDPKYPRRIDPLNTKPGPGVTPKTPVRIVRPEGVK